MTPSKNKPKRDISTFATTAPHMLPKDLCEEIEVWIRTKVYGCSVDSASALSRMLGANDNFRIDGRPVVMKAQTMASWVERILEEDARQERVREAMPLEYKRNEHIKRRKYVFNRSMDNNDMLAANVAADKLMVLDGIAPEAVKIERSVTQLTDTELLEMQKASLLALSPERKILLLSAAAERLTDREWDAICQNRSRTVSGVSKRAIASAEGAGVARLDDL